MKWLLIVVTFPGNIMPGDERHIPFDSKDDCESARAGVKLDERGGLVYCTTQENETWFYTYSKPKVTP